jgi:hypothetical protein
MSHLLHCYHTVIFCLISYLFYCTEAWSSPATPPALFVMGLFELGSCKLFSLAGFKLQFYWSLPPEWLRLQAWATRAQLLPGFLSSPCSFSFPPQPQSIHNPAARRSSVRSPHSCQPNPMSVRESNCLWGSSLHTLLWLLLPWLQSKRNIKLPDILEPQAVLHAWKIHPSGILGANSPTFKSLFKEAYPSHFFYFSLFLFSTILATF